MKADMGATDKRVLRGQRQMKWRRIAGSSARAVSAWRAAQRFRVRMTRNVDARGGI